MPGDTVYSLLKKNGFTDDQRKAALGKVSIPDDFVLSPGDLYSLVKDKKANRTELIFYAKNKPVSYNLWRVGATNAGGITQKLNYNVKVVKAAGRIRGSLVESISKAVGDDLLAYRFMDAFILDYNLPKVLQKNAPFALSFEKLYHKGQFIRHGEILSASIEIDGEDIERTYRGLKRGGIFFNPDNDYSDRPFYAPVDYIRVSSLFQPRRFHPIKKYRKAHQGIDFELPEGSPIYSIEKSTVLRLGRQRGAGRFIVLRHANGYESYYNHMSAVENFKVGQKINAGVLIGRVGCTGYCTKPHLHFAIKKHGRFIDPIRLVRGYSYSQRSEINRLFAYSAE